MTYQVKLKSGKYTFSADSHESILDAAIRAGVPLNYGCSNGNCGLCKARVFSGDIKPLRSHDFVIRDADKIQGDALMCSNACHSDVVIDANVAQSVSDIPIQELRVKVRKIDRVSDDLAIISLQVPRTVRLRFLAGQYMRVYDDQQRSHEFAIASCPCDEKRIEFHVRKLDEDAFSDLVFKQLKIGDWLNIQGPFGEFVIDDSSDAPIVMIAFDTGFAAIKSLLEHTTAQEKERPLYLYWLACGAEGLYLDNLCRSWDDALDELHYLPLHMQRGINEILDSEYEGMCHIEDAFSASLHHIEHVLNSEVYLVSPEPVAKLVEQLLIAKGFEAASIHHEVIRGNPNLKCIHPISES
ncbi:MAG: 2Fe-2S iron-sulfur cluster-binding protein [Pseudomonadota bacterium]